MLKFIVVVLLLIALYQLGSAFRYFMLDDVSSKQKMATALAWRVGISVLIFVILLGAFVAGWLAPSESLSYLIAPSTSQ